jgi:TBC1 domain family member 13
MGLEGVRDNFVQVLDDTQWGIGSNMKRLFELIKSKDTVVYNQLEKQNLKPEYFAFRWISLLLSQEFSMPGLLN